MNQPYVEHILALLRQPFMQLCTPPCIHESDRHLVQTRVGGRDQTDCDRSKTGAIAAGTLPLFAGWWDHFISFEGLEASIISGWNQHQLRSVGLISSAASVERVRDLSH